MPFPPQNLQNVQGFGNYAPQGPYQPLPAEYWQNMSHPYFTPSVVHGYGTPHTTGMSFTPSMSNEPATPTFVPETQLSDRESPIEVVNLEKTVSNAEGTRKRSSWTKVEDEVLARSFVTISDDPIIGNDQKADAFWGRVASYYNENLSQGSNTRSANVIRSHWHNTIQKKVYRFNANYNSIYSSYRSGHSDEDILRFAYEKYLSENNGVAFNLEHVWRIVKDRPMFTPQSADHFVATKKTRTSESGASNTSSNQDVSIDLDYEDTRPMGQKAAKRKGKDKVKSTMEDLTVNYNNIITKFTEYTSVKKSEVDLKQKQLEVEEIKAKAALSKSKAKNRRLKLKEYEILNKDTSQMTKEQLIIHECLCKDIRSRWNI
ncbi:glutathione S-transferase T3-like [Zingiber officinale]|uniref:glutathione S-transferase T3-like n=1 Tax=Zingiber officinale TaxID=94328 RepID=UPI001C4D83A7|nr:glutathione S-transferase T3-like [Zingiber officinale]